MGAAHVVAVEIDTYKQTRVSSSAFGLGMLRKGWQALEKRRERRLSTGLDPLNSLHPSKYLLAAARKGAAAHRIAGSASCSQTASLENDRPLAYKRLILEVRSVHVPILAVDSKCRDGYDAGWWLVGEESRQQAGSEKVRPDRNLLGGFLPHWWSLTHLFRHLVSVRH